MRKGLIGLSVLAALVLGDLAAWRVGVGVLDGGVDRWIAQARAAGWSVSAGARERGGWPASATLAVSAVRIGGGERLMPGGLMWSARRIVLSVSLWHPMTLMLAPEGSQHLRLSHAPDMVFAASRLVAQVPLWGPDVGGAAVQASGLAGGIIGTGHPQDVQLSSLDLRLVGGAAARSPGGTGSARLEIEVRGIGLPDIGRWPLGATLSSAGGILTLTSPPTPHDDGGRDAATSDPEDQARAWRDGGGRLEARGVHLHWGPLSLSADATLMLDERLQPAGTGLADVIGSAAALDALVSGGVLAAGLASTGKAVLALMSHPPSSSEALRLPFVLRDSTLSVGQIPVVRLGGIVWRRRAG